MQQETTPRMPEQPAQHGRVLAMRLATALVQAAALYLLTPGATVEASWQTAYPALFIPLLLVFTYVPVVVMPGLGQMRGRPLMIWTWAAAVVIAGLGYHAAARGSVLEYPDENDGRHGLNAHRHILLLLSAYVLGMLAAFQYLAGTLRRHGSGHRRECPRRDPGSWKRA